MYVVNIYDFSASIMLIALRYCLPINRYLDIYKQIYVSR